MPRHQTRTWRGCKSARSFGLKKFGALEVLIPIKPWMKSKVLIWRWISWFVGSLVGMNLRLTHSFVNIAVSITKPPPQVCHCKKSRLNRHLPSLLPQLRFSTQKCGGLRLGRASWQTGPANKNMTFKRTDMKKDLWPLWSVWDDCATTWTRWKWTLSIPISYLATLGQAKILIAMEKHKIAMRESFVSGVSFWDDQKLFQWMRQTYSRVIG